MAVPSLSLEGKAALVTGAASVRGMGRAIALTLAGAGADVAVCDLRVSGDDFDLEGTAAEIRKLGRRSLAVQADLTKEGDVAGLFQRVAQEFGRLDVLVNNAGLSAHHTLLQMPTDLWDKAIEVNLKAPFLCCQAAARLMVEQKSGVIVNMASISGLRFGSASAYGIAKAGVIVLTGWAARELAPHNVRVNAIAPGAIDTDFGRHRVGLPPWEITPSGPTSAPPRPGGGGGGGAPLGRRGEAADIADVALFLASDAARYITGQTIVVDGGVMVS
ncbi:MAG TPA: SDR family NAD(P)-dependent oxidoreductase [Dehalococcoidia bacterium]